MTAQLLSKERLEKIASMIDLAGPDHILGFTAGEVSAMASALLAVYEQEPVATLDVQSGREDGKTFALAYSSAAHKLPDDVYFLYTHPAPELSAIVDRLNLSGYEHEDGEVTPQNAAAVVDILLQQLDESVQGRDTHPAPSMPLLSEHASLVSEVTPLVSEQEPAAWIIEDEENKVPRHFSSVKDYVMAYPDRKVTPLYTHPAPSIPAVPESIQLRKALAWLDEVIQNNPGMKEPVTCRAAMLNGGKS